MYIVRIGVLGMIDSDDTTYVNIDDIGTRYDILRVLSRL